jgi:tetratricopeptide (TPR) repeat protein
MARWHKKLQVEEKSRVFARLADTFRRSHHFEEAIELCHRGLVHHPDYVSGHIVLGQCYLDLGRLEEARDCFVRALALDEDNILTLRCLGDIQFQQGELEAAADHYRRALRLDPRSQDLRELLRDVESKLEETAAPPEKYSQEQDREESSTEMSLSMMSVPAFGREVLKPTDTEEHRRWLREMTQENEPTEAMDETADADGDFPHPGDDAAGRNFQDYDLRDRTQDDRSPAHQPMNDAGLSPQESRLLHDEDDEHSAKGPPRGMATATLAEIYFQQGYLDKAIEIYQKVLRHHPDDEESRARLSELRGMRASRSETNEGASQKALGNGSGRDQDEEMDGSEKGGEQSL